MQEQIRLEISAGLAGQRADAAVLAMCPETVRRAVVKAFEEGAVRREGPEGAVVLKGERVQAGEGLWIERLYGAADLRVIPEAGVALSVVYEDAALVGLNKPAGQACHPIDFGELGTLAGAFVARYPETAQLGEDPLAPGLVHRIDGGTSGLVVVARTAAAYEAVRGQFAAQTVVKEYRALVEGRVERAGAVSGLLAHTYKGGQMRMAVAAPGHHGARALKAETYFRPLGPGRGGTTLLAVTIRTGVTHQIRSQLASIGHPIVGDVLYGARPSAEWAPGTHALHSFSATFVHPVTQQKVMLQAAPSAILCR